MIYRVQKGGIYAGPENFKKHDLPRAEGGMYAGTANVTESSEVLKEPNASQGNTRTLNDSTNTVKSNHKFRKVCTACVNATRIPEAIALTRLITSQSGTG